LTSGTFIAAAERLSATLGRFSGLETAVRT
jgi:hypothetical protein